MPSVTINITGRGTPTSSGRDSSVGHMWYSLTDSNGVTQSYGFSPDRAHEGNPFAPGSVNANGQDDNFYLGRDFSKTIEISQSQYDAMKNFGENPSSGNFDLYYNGLSNSCIDFTWRAMNVGGLNPGNIEGSIWPTWNEAAVSSHLSPFRWIDPQTAIDQGLIDPKTLLPRMNPGVNSNYRAATTPRPRDPLAIDLDGDGIEVLGAGSNPVLFDHNADGIKTGTGWLKGDDAWLVMDRDGNGQIDSGRELFGVDTLISQAVIDSQGNPVSITRAATTGFEALASLDINGDKLFNASDAAFNQVRLWQDLNSDGISQANELTTLSQQNIVSISLTPDNSVQGLANGNSITGKSTVVRSNGTAGEAGSVGLNGTAANLNLSDNPFYRDFVAGPIAEAAQALPNMSGSGLVRDLRDAMSQGTWQARMLQDAVQKFSSATTRDAQMATVDHLLFAWANTGPEVRHVSHLGGNRGSLFGSGNSNNNDLRVQVARYGDFLKFAMPEWQTVLGQADFVQMDAAAVSIMDELVKMGFFRGAGGSYSSTTAANVGSYGYTGILSVFNGRPADTVNQIQIFVQPSGLGYSEWLAPFSADKATMDLFDAAYLALQQSVYTGLVLQTRLRPYLESIELIIDDDGISFDTAALTAMLESARTADAKNAFTDLIELARYADTTLTQVGFDGIGLLKGWIDELPADSPLRAVVRSLSVLGASDTQGTAFSDIFLGNEAANSFNGGADDDQILGWGGADTLDGGAGNDMLDGGAGNDRLTGGTGNDSYVFGLGAGKDVIDNFDAAADSKDVLRMTPGVLPIPLHTTSSILRKSMS